MNPTSLRVLSGNQSAGSPGIVRIWFQFLAISQRCENIIRTDVLFDTLLIERDEKDGVSLAPLSLSQGLRNYYPLLHP